MFVITYHRINTREQLQETRHVKNVHEMCEWVYRQLKRNKIDWYQIEQYHKGDTHHDVTDVYAKIIECGLESFSVK